MKTMKTCKMGCGKMKAGGTVKKIKKMAKGGAADYNFGYPLNGLPMRPTNGNTDISKNQMGTNPTMKKGGTTKMKKMMSGGSLKPVPTDKVGLSKLPTAVRNKMGYQKKGGTVKKK
jgi:hypothetical protein